MIKSEKGNNQVEANISKGVKQGCNLSPTLFNLYIEEALKEIRKENNGGVKIGGILVQMLRFADDIAVIGESEEDITNMLEKINDTLKEHYMKINQRKTKILICSKQQIYANITLDGIMLETVQSFSYLGSKISSDGKSRTDIVCRIAQAKQAYYKKRNLFTSNRISLDTRKSLIQIFVWSLALYGAETWTIMKAEKAKIEAFEVCC